MTDTNNITDLPTQIALPFPFAVVDSALYSWLGQTKRDLKGISFQHGIITSGTSHFRIIGVPSVAPNKPVIIGRYEVRMMDHNLTAITLVNDFPDRELNTKRIFDSYSRP